MKSIKELAQEIGVSKQAIFKRIKSEPLSTSLQGLISTVDGKLMVSVDGEKLIKEVFSHKEVSTQVDINQFTEVDSSVDGIITILQTTIDALKEQLLVKDKQIESLTESLKKSQEQQEKTLESLLSAQALHAGTLQKQLNESNEEPKEDSISPSSSEAIPEDKGFWTNLFRKKR